MLPAAQRCGILIMSALITIGLFFVADPVRHANAAQAGAVPIYRVYNPHSGLHHYTKVAPERDHLAALGWRLEGVSFNAVGGGIPVYREYNPHDGNHNWTMNANEHRMLIRTGWHNEGVAWYAPSSGQDVYRLYNPHSGEHVYNVILCRVSFRWKSRLAYGRRRLAQLRFDNLQQLQGGVGGSGTQYTTRRSWLFR